jgi:hypothetical protein
MASGGAAAVSGKVAVGDKLVAVDGQLLKGKAIGEVRGKLAGREGSVALLGVLRKEGVKPPPPDVNVVHVYQRREARRVMIASVSALLSDDGSPDLCLVKLKRKHALLEGMYVRVVLGGVSQTEPLQGRHRIAQVSGDDAFVLEAPIAAGLTGKDLTPDLFTYPSYIVRVPAPYLLPPVGPLQPAAQAGVGERVSGDECTEEEGMGLEEFKPYKQGSSGLPSASGEGARDIPPSLRQADSSAQRFWQRCAPARQSFDLYYPAFAWDDFCAALKREAAGGETALFGKFDFADESCLESLRAALEAAAGGQLRLPTNSAGAPIVPPRAFQAVVEEAARAPALAALPEDERQRYPPWLALHVPPVPRGGQDAVVLPQRLLQFGICTAAGGQSAGGVVDLRVDEAGMRAADAAARDKTVSRVVVVTGRRGSGKSFLCRSLVVDSVVSALKTQGKTEEAAEADGLMPRLAPQRSAGSIVDASAASGCTVGVVSYAGADQVR